MPKINIHTAIDHFAKNPKQTLYAPQLGLQQATVVYQKSSGNTINKLVMSKGKIVTGRFKADSGKLFQSVIETNNGTVLTRFNKEGLKNSIEMKPNTPVGGIKKFTRCFDGQHGRLTTPEDSYEPIVGYTRGTRIGDGPFNKEFNAVHSFIVNG